MKNCHNNIFIIYLFLLEIELLLQAYERGQDVVLYMEHQLLSDSSEYFVNIVKEGSGNPFVWKNELDETSPQGQEGRFRFSVNQTQDILRISLGIKNLEEIDKGTYYITVEESANGNYNSESYSRYVNVTFPPGKAGCELFGPDEVCDWATIKCRASIGSNEFPGGLTCIQKSKRLPIAEAAIDGSEIMATYYVIDQVSQVDCCSIKNQHQQLSKSDSLLGLCSDYSFQPTSVPLTSSASPRTPGLNSTQISIATGQPPQPNKSNLILLTVLIAVLPALLIVCWVCRRYKLSHPKLRNGHHGQMQHVAHQSQNKVYQSVDRQDSKSYDQESQTEMKGNVDGDIIGHMRDWCAARDRDLLSADILQYLETDIKPVIADNVLYEKILERLNDGQWIQNALDMLMRNDRSMSQERAAQSTLDELIEIIIFAVILQNVVKHCPNTKK